MDEFAGMRLVCVLKDPPGRALEGTVSKIEQGHCIFLDQVRGLNFQYAAPRIRVEAGNVQDIQAIPQNHSGPAPGTSAAIRGSGSTPAPVVPAPPSTAFQDPAILSVGRRPDSQTNESTDSRRQPNVGEKRDPPSAAQIKPPDSTASNVKYREKPAAESPLRLDTTEPAPTGTTEDESQRPTPTGPTAQVVGKAKKARSRRLKRTTTGNQRDDGNDSPATGAKQAGQGDGWRQTPILQSTSSFQPFASLKRGKKGRRDPNGDNGWASEDITDVQEAGDFDFESGLAKFDKRTIFDEIRRQDDVDDADRLVSQNRTRPKPGTAGGKNLHYSENVLDMPSTIAKLKETPDDFWKSEADDGTPHAGERMSGREGSGRNSRLRTDSRMSTNRRSQSRKASAAASVGGQGLGISGHVMIQGLYILPSNRRIETVTHLQMLNLENIVQNDIGFSEDLMAENAGRSIAEVALTAIDDPAVKLRAASVSPPTPTTIVILAGNHKLGSRAIAGGRHLRNRGVNVVVCVVGIEKEKDLIDDLRKQIQIFRGFGGAVCSKQELFEILSRAAASLSSSPQVSTTLIVDALLGLAISFEELRKGDQATTYELMEWANRNEAFVLAVDMPSGIDPTSGKVNIIDGGKLYVRPRYIVSLGAPKQGLLRALEDAEEQGDIFVEDWRLYLADIGLGPSLWRKAATKIRRGIDFDVKWVLEMRYQHQDEVVD